MEERVQRSKWKRRERMARRPIQNADPSSQRLLSARSMVDLQPSPASAYAHIGQWELADCAFCGTRGVDLDGASDGACPAHHSSDVFDALQLERRCSEQVHIYISDVLDLLTICNLDPLLDDIQSLEDRRSECLDITGAVDTSEAEPDVLEKGDVEEGHGAEFGRARAVGEGSGNEADYKGGGGMEIWRVQSG